MRFLIDYFFPVEIPGYVLVGDLFVILPILPVFQLFLETIIQKIFFIKLNIHFYFQHILDIVNFLIIFRQILSLLFLDVNIKRDKRIEVSELADVQSIALLPYVLFAQSETYHAVIELLLIPQIPISLTYVDGLAIL